MGAGLLMAEIDILDDDNKLVFSCAPGMKPGETAGGNLVKLDVLMLVAAQYPEPGKLRRYLRGFFLLSELTLNDFGRTPALSKR